MNFASVSMLIFFFVLKANAYEVDQFTRRNEVPTDSTKILDQEILKRFNLALNEANGGLIHYKCNGTDEDRTESRIALFKSLRNQLETSIPIGAIESFVNKNSQIKKRKIELSDSIYSAAKEKSFILRKFGVASVVQVNGVQIGTDKLGHFFNEGVTEYTLNYTASTNKQKFRNAQLHSIELEKDEHGLKTSGVFSYGDLSANHAGHKFWEKVCGFPNNDMNQSDKDYMKINRCKKEAYFQCDTQTGKWILNSNQQFSFKDYVTPAWDETINCSLYRADMAQDVFKEMNRRAYVGSKNPNQPCPAEPQKCAEIQTYYSKEVARLLTSPICKKIIEAEKSKSPISKTEKFDYSYDTYQNESSQIKESSTKKIKVKN